MTISLPILDELCEFVDNMIVQNSYPGFEARGFRIGLPEKFNSAGSRVFAEALGSPSVYVRIVGLRWFQDKPGTIRPHLKAIYGLLDSPDEWIRAEALTTLERFGSPNAETAMLAAKLLEDENVMVRKSAAKALAKILPRARQAKEATASRESNLQLTEDLLKKAMLDKDPQVRQKAEKALRRGGILEG